MAAKPPSLDTIFCTAIEIASAEDRGKYMDQACGADDDLRARVEALVAAHFQAGSFMETPAPHFPLGGKESDTDGLPPTIDAPIAERPGTVIGPYKLLEQIGEGGFGVVFLAEQQAPLRRKVALKVLKPGMDSRQVLARFEAERQTLALMDHPNIAHVFDGGSTESGRPYFVMELVRGIPITKFCDQANLPIRNRLDLFVSVCQAVQHAHQKGIIHRDIKPSNVLVTLHDGTPAVKVIDFGVAKALGQQLTEKTLFTQFAQFIGTPTYMSPEQAALSGLDVDTRSDVYSLGVLLYELLTGKTPFDEKRLREVSFDELRRIIREEEPIKPSTRISTLGQDAATVSAHRKSDPKRLSQLFRGELDWIVVKALEKDRNRRYESASALAADVQRYLRDEAVLACPPSVGYLLRKIVRRYRKPVLAVGIVFAVLLAGMAGTIAGLVRAERASRAERLRAKAEADAKEKAIDAEKLAEQRRGEAEQARDLARTNYVMALDAFDQMVGSIQNKLEVRAGTQELRKDLLVNARAGLQKLLLEAEKQGNPDRALAWTYLRVGDVEMALGNTQAAQKEFRAGHELALRLAEADPKNALAQRDLSASYHRLGDVTLKLGQTKDALEYYRKGLQIAQQLAGDAPKDIEALHALFLSNYRFGDVTLELGHTEEALDLYQKDLLLAQRLAEVAPNTAKAQQSLKIIYEKLGDTMMLKKRPIDALDFYKKNHQIVQSLADADPKNVQTQVDLSISFIKLGDVMQQLGKKEDYVEFYQKSSRILLRQTEADPSNTHAQRGLMANYERRGSVALQIAQPKEALTYYQKVSQIAQRLAEADPKNTQAQHDLAVSYENLGDVTRILGQMADALEYYQKGLAISQRRAESDPENIPAQILLYLGFLKLGGMAKINHDYAKAAEWFAKARAVLLPWHDKKMLVGQYQNAIADVDKYIADCQIAEKAINSIDFVFTLMPDQIPGLLNLRVKALLTRKQLVEATATAERFADWAEKQEKGREDQRYNAAATFALCAWMRKSDALVSQAIALLTKAKANGYFTAERTAHIKQDNEFSGIRWHPKFVEFLATLEPKK